MNPPPLSGNKSTPIKPRQFENPNVKSRDARTFLKLGDAANATGVVPDAKGLDAPTRAKAVASVMPMVGERLVKFQVVIKDVKNEDSVPPMEGWIHV